MTQIVTLPPNLILGAPPFEAVNAHSLSHHSEESIRAFAIQMADAHPERTWYLDGAMLVSDSERMPPVPIPAEFVSAVEAFKTMYRQGAERRVYQRELQLAYRSELAHWLDDLAPEDGWQLCKSSQETAEDGRSFTISITFEKGV